MLRSVAVIALPDVAVFELGVLCELFGYDRTAEGLPAYEFAVCSADGGEVRTHAGFSISPAHGLGPADEADLVEAFKDANAPLEIRPFSMLAAILHLAEVLADACEQQADRIAALELAVPELVEHLHMDLDFLRLRLDGCGDPGQDVELMLK